MDLEIKKLNPVDPNLKTNDRGTLHEKPINDALVPAQPVSPVMALPTALILWTKGKKNQIEKDKIKQKLNNNKDTH